MTPLQAAAFAHPVTDAACFSLNALVDTATGAMRPAPPAADAKAGLLARWIGPRLSPRRHEETELWALLSRYERGFRVSVCVDATAATAAQEQWPCWHVLVVYGELVRGIAGPALPVARWGALRCRLAEHILRRELAGVGEVETTAVLDRARVLAAWHRLGGQEPMALVGRRRMTQDEAELCFAHDRSVLARLNPTYAEMDDLFEEAEG